MSSPSSSVDHLSFVKKVSYGVGHILNDLSASMWFSYLLIFLHKVVRLDNAVSGYMMFVGQVADAISTLFVGFESDRTENGFCNYGRRKSWHLVGVISVLISFPFMYNLCPTCENAPQWALFIYYSPFVVIFQFGWAATQISHLSLIPQLTPHENERVALNAIRYACTVLSNLFVYATAFVLLKTGDRPGPDDDSLGPYDAPKFMILSLIVCGVGSFFMLVFHMGTNERGMMSDDQIRLLHAHTSEESLNWRGYLKCTRFYMMGLLYMCTRLIVNMTQVYLPMFITDTLNLDKSTIALIPFICYTSGFFSTFPLRLINKKIGPYLTYFAGLIIICGCAALFWKYELIRDKYVTIIVAAVLLGAGSTVILVTSLSLTANLIGKNTGSGAFVYGAMSFTDKLSNGIVVAVIQQISPPTSTSGDCDIFIHNIITFLPVVCSALALIGLILLRLYQKDPSAQIPSAAIASSIAEPINYQQTETVNENDNNDDISSRTKNYGTI